LREALPPLDELRRRAARVKGDHGLCERLIAACLQSCGRFESSVHVEEQIYDGFANNNDNALMERFLRLTGRSACR